MRNQPATRAISKWHHSHTSHCQSLQYVSETVQSNWLEILALPAQIAFYEIGRPLRSPVELQSLTKEISWPSIAHYRLLGGFAELADFQADLSPSTPLKTGYRLSLSSFLDDKKGDGPAVPRSEARKMTVNLIRQAWDRAMQEQGLMPYQLSERATAWWVPAGIIPEDTVWFMKVTGKRGWRKLVGRDNRRDLFWHFGVRAVPMLFPFPRFALRPHVVFTRDGHTALSSKWRRSVCKSWFNAKWRDLLAAYTAHLAGNYTYISLPVSSTAGIILSPTLMTMSAPVSLAPDQEPGASIVTQEGDEDDFDGIDRERDPAFMADDFDDQADDETEEADL